MKEELIKEFIAVNSKNPRSIYFVGDGRDNVKIGMTNDINKRFKQLQTCNPDRLSLIGFIEDGCPALEKLLHDKFSHLHVRGEWYHDCDGEITDFLIRIGYRYE